ncbi:MAG TPA: ATP-binding cassette domain-containing protein [Aliidiomarina sp.]|nr:ATP-binding cassette domain-containing protein [Aliidiomarina sp.]
MKHNWQQLKPWFKALKPARRKLAFGLFFSLLAAFSGVGLLALSGWFITASAFAGILGTGLLVNIYTPGAGIRLFAVTRTVGRYLERLVQHDAVLKVQTLWRVKLFKGLTERDIRWLHGQQTSLLIHRLTRNLNVLDLLWLRFVTPLVTASLISFSVVLFIAIWSGALAILVLLFLLVIFSLSVFQTMRISVRFATTENEAEEQFRRDALDYVEGLAEITAWGLGAKYRSQLMAQNDSFMQVREQRLRSMVGYQSVVVLLQQLMALLTAVGSVYLWQQGQLSGPVAVMLPITVLALSDLILPLATQANVWGDVLYAARQLNQLVKPAAITVETPKHSVLVNEVPSGLYVSPLYINQRQRVLIDMPSWQLQPQQHVAICAASGVGKSSLADHLSGLVQSPNVGVYWQGKALADLNNDQRSQRISYLSQRNFIINGTLWENLRLADANLTEDAAWQVLAWVALDKWAQRLPQGLDTWLGEQGELVSGGQGRRIALARILLTDPELAIFDEPFTGVDHATQKTIMNRMQPWLLKRTVIYFAHDFSVLPGSHVKYWLDEKQLKPSK